MTRGKWKRVQILTLLWDLVALAAGYHWAVPVRIACNPLLPIQLNRAQLEELVPPLGLTLFWWLLATYWLRLYRFHRKALLPSFLRQVLEAMVLAMVLTIVCLFFVRGFGRDFSRSFVLLSTGLGVLGMAAGRVLLWLGIRLADHRGRWADRVLVVGKGQGVKTLVQKLEAGRLPGFQVCGAIESSSAGRASGGSVLGNPVPVLGGVGDLPVMINRHRIDRVIAVEEEVSAEEMRRCISTCARMGIPFNHTGGVLHIASTRLGMIDAGNLVLVEIQGVEFTGAQRAIKRLIDVVVAAGLLAFLAPAFLLLGLGIRLSSRGPVLYVAPRVGRGGRHFSFLKFRSMVVDAEGNRMRLAGRNEKGGPLFKIQSDPRITPLGRFLRRFSLDELPQLINVLRGEMSLVGPRALPAEDLDGDGDCGSNRTWARERNRVRPGITGLWQVRGRSDLSFQDMVRLDLTYLRNWSLRLDVRILLETFPVVFRGKGAW